MVTKARGEDTEQESPELAGAAARALETAAIGRSRDLNTARLLHARAELGKNTERWEKTQRDGKRRREMGKDAERWEKTQRALLVQFLCTINIAISASARRLRANARCQVRAGLRSRALLGAKALCELRCGCHSGLAWRQSGLHPWKVLAWAGSYILVLHAMGFSPTSLRAVLAWLCSLISSDSEKEP